MRFTRLKGEKFIAGDALCAAAAAAEPNALATLGEDWSCSEVSLRVASIRRTYSKLLGEYFDFFRKAEAGRAGPSVPSTAFRLLLATSGLIKALV
jgi:hypothetical protein